MPGTISLIATFAAAYIGGGAVVSTAVYGIVQGAIYLGLSVGLSYLSGLLFAPKQPRPEDVQVSVKNPIAPRQRHYGRVKTSGPWVFGETKDGWFHKVLALGTGKLDAIEEYWIDDQHVTLAGDGKVISDGPLDDQAYIFTRLGNATETHYANLEGYFPEWDDDHRGDGVASLYGILTAMPPEDYSETFPKGAETMFRVVARASLVYDPVGGATNWSDNAARVIRDYMTHADGMRLPPAVFQTPQAQAGWIEATNRCAEAIPLKAGGTEPRYRLWGSYKFDERPADVLGRMMACCDGRMAPTADGGMTLKIGTWAEPTVTLDEDAIVGFSELSRGRDILSTANIISATYMSPRHDYQATDADRWIDEADVAVRGEIATDRQFLMSPSHGQTRRLMKLAAWRANPKWVGSFECNLRALAALGEPYVRIVYPLFEIDEVFEISDLRLNVGEGGILLGVTVQVASMPSQAYDWNAAAEEGTEPLAEEVAVDTTIPVPEDFTFTEGTITVGGNPISVGVITFAAPPDGLRVEGRYKRVSGSEWSQIPISPGQTAAQTGALDDGVQYEAQVRHVTITGRTGEWTESETLTPLSNPTPPKALSSFTLTGSAPRLGNAQFSIATQNDDNLRHVALYRVPSGGTLDRATHLVTKIPVTTSASTYAYTDGDSTRTNQAVNGDMSSATGWTIPADWSIAAGVAHKVAGGGTRHLYQSVSPSGLSAKIRWQLTVLNYSAGSFFMRISDSAGVQVAQSTPAMTANGTYRGTLQNGGAGATRIGPVGATTAAGDVDDFIQFEETAGCAPAGAWDYYAEPLNPSGVAGTLVGPRAATII